MCERVGMPSPTSTRVPRWWHRRGPSLVALSVFVVVLALVTVVAAGQVVDVLPEVAKDQLGEDRWEDPLGVERSGEFQIGHIPACAEGPVTRIVLWDSESEPYWEVAAAVPTPLTAFIIGVTPTGFTEVVPYRPPPIGRVLRLVAFRRVGGPIGLRYRTSQLRTGRLVSGTPLTSYTIEGFQDEPVCSDSPPSDDDVATTTTVVAGLLPAGETTTVPGSAVSTTSTTAPG